MNAIKEFTIMKSKVRSCNKVIINLAYNNFKPIIRFLHKSNIIDVDLTILGSIYNSEPQMFKNDVFVLVPFYLKPLPVQRLTDLLGNEA